MGSMQENLHPNLSVCFGYLGLHHEAAEKSHQELAQALLTFGK